MKTLTEQDVVPPLTYINIVYEDADGGRSFVGVRHSCPTTRAWNVDWFRSMPWPDGPPPVVDVRAEV